MTTAERVWTKDEIAHLLETNDGFLFRALGRVYERQTAEEQLSQATLKQNGVGFNGVDAQVLSDIYTRSLRYGGLTARQTALVRRKMRKYAGQVTQIANGRL